jgi:uncharacterized protein involved in exopolysaccharide biosynthesis
MMAVESQQGVEGSHSSFSQRDFLTIVFKRRTLIAVFVATVVVMVMAMSLLAPDTYEVSATLLVNEARAEMPIAPAASQPLIINQVSIANPWHR